MKRPLSALERRMVLLSRRFIGNGVMCVRIRGRLDEARLRLALDTLQRRHPLLAARLVREQGLLTFTSEGAPPLRLRVVPDHGSGEHWRAVAAAALVTPLDLATGPPVRFVWIRRPGGEGADLVVAIHHAAGDASSVLSAIRDLLTFAAAPETPPGTTPETTVEPVPPLAVPDAIVAVPAADPFPRAAPPDGHLPSTSPPPGSPSAIAITTAQLPPGPMQALVHRCREEGVTVHAALCAAIGPPLAALFAHESTLTISSPVSYRHCLRHPHAQRAFGNFIVFIDSSMDCAPSLPFWERARALHRQLSEQTADDAVLGLVSSMEAASRAEPDDEAFLHRSGLNTASHDISISNVGRQPIPTRYGELSIESIYSGSCLPGELVLFVVTLDDTMHLTLMSNGLSEAANHSARRALASALEALAAPTGDSGTA